MNPVFQRLLTILKSKRFQLFTEKVLQLEIMELLSNHFKPEEIQKEFVLDTHSIIDFLLFENVGIEVKMNGQKKAIYKQCERYCSFPTIQYLILITSKAIGMPESINGKPVLSINISRAWL